LTYAVFLVGYHCALLLADATDFREAEAAAQWFRQEVADRSPGMDLAVEIRQLVLEQWLPLTVEV